MPDPDRLEFWSTNREHAFERLVIGADGSIAADADERLPGPLVRTPPFALGPVEPGSQVVHAMRGPVFSAFAPDGRSFYLRGLYAARTRYGSFLEVATDGFWRDGQVWRVDRTTGTASVFFALDAKAIPTSREDRATALGGAESVSALHGVALDASGHVFVCDRLNSRLAANDMEAGTNVWIAHTQMPLMRPKRSGPMGEHGCNVAARSLLHRGRVSRPGFEPGPGPSEGPMQIRYTIGTCDRELSVEG